jgi:hypothetical protein
VVAFNQDVAAFSQHLSTHLQEFQSGPLHFSSGNRSFISDGLVTVRGIGGDPSDVETATQSILDATQAKTLSDVIATLTGQGGSGSGSSSTSPLASAIQNGSVNATAILPAIAALAPVSTKASIGRELLFSVTPHTLPGASSAELEVELTAAESGDPSLYASGKNVGPDNVSNVARHYVKTRVRVESVKMFELSAFSALIQRPRNKVPLVPPLIELPWVGSLLSLPLSGAKEYHRSTAFVSAVIVPTAADLAYGIEFAPDRRIVERPAAGDARDFEMRDAVALTQFANLPISAYHKTMVNCIATDGGMFFLGGKTGPSLAAKVAEDRWIDPATKAQRQGPPPPSGGCFSLKFSDVPPEF